MGTSLLRSDVGQDRIFSLNGLVLAWESETDRPEQLAIEQYERWIN